MALSRWRFRIRPSMSMPTSSEPAAAVQHESLNTNAFQNDATLCADLRRRGVASNVNDACCGHRGRQRYGVSSRNNKHIDQYRGVCLHSSYPKLRSDRDRAVPSQLPSH